MKAAVLAVCLLCLSGLTFGGCETVHNIHMDFQCRDYQVLCEGGADLPALLSLQKLPDVSLGAAYCCCTIQGY